MAKSKDIVRALYDAFGKGDVPSILGTFHPQIQWQEAENSMCAAGNPFHGPQSVAEGVFQRHVSDVEDFAVVPGRFVDGGDIVVVEGRYHGTVKATGRPIDAQFAHVWELRDGKVVRFQQYTDTKQWSDAVDV
jgi:uncharacterized protein